MPQLKLILEIVITLIKVVDPHITILSPAAVPFTVRVECEGIDRTEMPLHSAYFLLKYQVEEPENRSSF